MDAVNMLSVGVAVRKYLADRSYVTMNGLGRDILGKSHEELTPRDYGMLTSALRSASWRRGRYAWTPDPRAMVEGARP